MARLKEVLRLEAVYSLAIAEAFGEGVRSSGLGWWARRWWPLWAADWKPVRGRGGVASGRVIVMVLVGGGPADAAELVVAVLLLLLSVSLPLTLLLPVSLLIAVFFASAVAGVDVGARRHLMSWNSLDIYGWRETTVS